MSVDPLAEDYASYSPYNYVLGNPILLTDPDGRAPDNVIIKGPKAEEATEELNASTNLNITRNAETGKLSATGEAGNAAESQLLEAINSETNHVVLTTTHKAIAEVDGGKSFLLPGAFQGSKKDFSFVKDENGMGQFVTSSVTGEQTINMKAAGIIAGIIGEEVGQTVMHEINEAFIGTQINPGGSHASGYTLSHLGAAALDQHPGHVSFRRSVKDTGLGRTSTTMQVRPQGSDQDWTDIIKCNPKCRVVNQ